MQRLDDLEQRLARGLRQMFGERRAGLIERQGRLWRMTPAARVHGYAIRLNALLERLRAAGNLRLQLARERFLPLVRTLQAVSPLATLDRGYAIVTTASGEILRDAEAAAAGATIEARLAHGRIRAKVESTSS
jgi:exodeoxyribonuclease VII large subunit